MPEPHAERLSVYDAQGRVVGACARQAAKRSGLRLGAVNVLLVPLALLLRIALRLRGSQVGAVWAELLAGFVFLCFGDIFFAYFSALGEQQLDPYVHATYLLSYGLVAGGAHRQLLLLQR